MVTLKFITIGSLKEEYLKSAVQEYEKRLSGFGKIINVNLKEVRISPSPPASEIKASLSEEGKAILGNMSDRSYNIALCVEGKQFSSEELAETLESVCLRTNEICFIIGSSHGLSDEVKNAADLKLSLSKLTFPHQLMRVILLETVYRSMSIIKGTKYHK